MWLRQISTIAALSCSDLKWWKENSKLLVPSTCSLICKIYHTKKGQNIKIRIIYLQKGKFPKADDQAWSRHAKVKRNQLRFLKIRWSFLPKSSIRDVYLEKIANQSYSCGYHYKHHSDSFLFFHTMLSRRDLQGYSLFHTSHLLILRQTAPGTW